MQTATPTYRRYHVAELAGLAVLTILGLIFSPATWAAWCILLSWGYAFLRDGRGAISLRGRIPWRRLPLLVRLVAIPAYVVLYPLLFAAYVVLAMWDAYQWYKQAPARTQAHIAQLERELHVGQQPPD